jgi:hypothetical protein
MNESRDEKRSCVVHHQHLLNEGLFPTTILLGSGYLQKPVVIIIIIIIIIIY